VGHKLRFSLVLINDSCVVQVSNYTIAHLHALLSLINPHLRKIAIYAPLEYKKAAQV